MLESHHSRLCRLCLFMLLLLPQLHLQHHVLSVVGAQQIDLSGRQLVPQQRLQLPELVQVPAALVCAVEERQQMLRQRGNVGGCWIEGCWGGGYHKRLLLLMLLLLLLVIIPQANGRCRQPHLHVHLHLLLLLLLRSCNRDHHPTRRRLYEDDASGRGDGGDVTGCLRHTATPPKKTE